ncbi:hypothetical protein EPN96_01860 [bacterium]|nr:MAG: hypothetical protein EPN96_01860 [bacterium]
MKKGCFILALSLFFANICFAGPVWVKGYTRSDGTYVPGHYRSSPDNTIYNNYGRDYNPYKIEAGPVLPPREGRDLASNAEAGAACGACLGGFLLWSFNDSEEVIREKKLKIYQFLEDGMKKNTPPDLLDVQGRRFANSLGMPIEKGGDFESIISSYKFTWEVEHRDGETTSPTP